MSREHRIVTALGPTAMPVPDARARRGRRGERRPFYLMEFVDGVVLDSATRPSSSPMAMRAVTAEHLIDVLADLHAVDVDEVGLGDLARRDGTSSASSSGGCKQWELSKRGAAGDRGGRGAATVAACRSAGHGHRPRRLPAREPPRRPRRRPGQRRARLGLRTLGDPLADVGYLSVYWTDPGQVARRANDPTGGRVPVDGRLDRAVLVAPARDV